MTLGRIEEILDEVQGEAEMDYRPETFRYVLDTLNEVRYRLGLDRREQGE